jgi:hypothetical protein
MSQVWSELALRPGSEFLGRAVEIRKIRKPNVDTIEFKTVLNKTLKKLWHGYEFVVAAFAATTKSGRRQFAICRITVS